MITFWGCCFASKNRGKKGFRGEGGGPHSPRTSKPSLIQDITREAGKREENVRKKGGRHGKKGAFLYYYKGNWGDLCVSLIQKEGKRARGAHRKEGKKLIRNDWGK